MKYSICIPVYNVKTYLKQCLNSAVNQSYNDYEIIIVDDGSTDGSQNVCDQYSRLYNNIRVIHKTNQGLMMARKSLVEAARGDYILFLDGDDYYAEDALKTIDTYIEKYNMPDILMYSFYRTFVNKEKVDLLGIYEMYGKSDVVLTNLEFLELFMESYRYNSVATKVIKRKIIEAHIDEIYSNTNCGEDAIQTAFFLKYSRNVVLIDAPLYYYRQRGNSMIHNTSFQSIDEIVNSLETVKEIVDAFDFVKKDIKGTNDRRYAVNVLNNFLEHIYNYNLSKKYNNDEKVSCLLYFKNCRLIKPIIEEVNPRELPLYNRVRLICLKNEWMDTLIHMDKCIYLLQMTLNRCQREIKYE